MKQYLGNYMGLVINNADPEYRGRVQVFIPHIMPALYEGWNKEGKDIQISCVGSNIPEGLDPGIHQKLIEILPWAEAASPIIGSSAPGNLFSDMVAGAKAGAATGGIMGAVTGAAAAATNHFYNQGPTSAPVQVEGGDAQGLINKAKGIANLDYDPNVTLDNTHKPGQQWGMCARGTTGLDKAAGLIDNNGPSAGFNAASDLAAGGSLFNKSKAGSYTNPYTTGTGAKYFRPAFTIPPNIQYNETTKKKNLVGAQVGDSVFAGGGGKGHGHAQKLVGIDKNGDQVWVSDNPQATGFFDNYNNFTVYRLNDEGLAKYTAAIGGKVTGQEIPSSATAGSTADAGSAGPNPLTNAQGAQNPVAPPETTMTAGGPGTGTPAGTSVPGPSPSATPGMKAFLAAVAKGESGFSVTEANTNTYNQAYADPKIANANVRKSLENKPGYLPANGDLTAAQKFYGDYGFFQNNDANEGASVYNYLKNQGFDEDRATFYRQAITNGQGKGSFSLTDQSQAMVYLMAAKHPTIKSQLDLLDPNNPNFANQVASITSPLQKKWFGLDEGLAAGAADPNSSSFAKINGTELVNAENSGALTGGSGPSVVNNTDGGGRTPVLNTNDMASGLFAYPNPGAMVWVFFREGNPLFPVYFAASYSSAEWKSAYRGGSPAEGNFNEGGIIGTGTIMKLGPEGGILSQNRTNLTDPLDNNASITLFHQHGSNITMKDGYDYFYSRNNKRDEVDNDRFVITKGYKEEWTEGDASTNTRGNLIVKVGNISQEAIDAMNELANMSYEMNQKLMEKSKS